MLKLCFFAPLAHTEQAEYDVENAVHEPTFSMLGRCGLKGFAWFTGNPLRTF